jgi:hypothetical protein
MRHLADLLTRLVRQRNVSRSQLALAKQYSNLERATQLTGHYNVGICYAADPLFY